MSNNNKNNNSSNSNNTKFIYSTDGSHKNICKKCEETPCRCVRIAGIDPKNVTVKMRIEKNGRGGKTVTVLFGLPNNSTYFTELTKKLKAQCGSGGTYKDGQIEIQGDHLKSIRIFLEKMGFKVKG
jgi:translation initiation factor 1